MGTWWKQDKNKDGGISRTRAKMKRAELKEPRQKRKREFGKMRGNKKKSGGMVKRGGRTWEKEGKKETESQGKRTRWGLAV